MEHLEEALTQRNRQLEAVFQITSALYARAKEGLRAPALDELLQETLQVALEVVGYVSPFLEEPNRSLIQDAFRDFDGLFEETMAILNESAEQLQRSVREIADAVKGAISPPHFVPTSVNEVAEKVLLALKPVAQQQGVELKLDTTPDLPIAPEQQNS